MKSKPKAPGFLSIFLLTIMITVQVLTLGILWLLQMLPMELLVIVGCVMVILSTLILRMTFSRKVKRQRLRRFVSGMLTLCTIVLCVGACLAA
ncbi:MAG: hypothetical protein IIV43_08235 [Oscillospiraceae bacterium]|nr:hypothetical protein [Oscillospiraceae bacterium]